MRNNYGKIRKVELGATNALPDLTLSTFREVNMAKPSLPKFQPFPKNQSRFTDLTGLTFGRLTVVGYVGSCNGFAEWLCHCECGHATIVKATNLRRGYTKSCGCRGRSVFLTHGASSSPEYEAFQSAKFRCIKVTNSEYKNYGGRGIEFRFASFPEFLSHIGPRPSKNHSLDRENVNGHYEPGNVRWATQTEQQRNRRDNRNVEYRGVTLTVAGWAEQLGIKCSLLRHRLDAHWCLECVFNLPLHSSCRHRASGTKYDAKPKRVAAHQSADTALPQQKVE